MDRHGLIFSQSEMKFTKDGIITTTPQDKSLNIDTTDSTDQEMALALSVKFH